MLLENNPYPRDVRVRAEAEALVRAGHAVTVIAPREQGQPRRERIAGVDVRRFRLVDGSARGAVGFAREYLVAGAKLNLAALRALIGGATVLHLHNPPDIFFPAGAIYRLARRRVVFDHHDLFPETIELKLGAGAPAVSKIASFCQRLTYAVANHVIATNASYAEIAISAGAKRREQVTIVRNAPPSAWTRMPIRHRPGRLDDLRLAYVGAISSQDGVDGLAPVLGCLAEAVDARLTIIGDGDGRPAVERALSEYRVADRVTFAGWVERERVVELLQEADVCVDPTPATWVNERSTMIKMAEYLALGKPVVGYDLLEARRTAADAAMLAPPGDAEAFAAALRQLAEDPALREELSLKARNRALELTWDHSERALLEAYQALR